MAAKPAPKGQTTTAKHAGTASASAKHGTSTTGSAKHGTKPAAKTATKHKPAAKPAPLSKQIQAQVNKLVAADVKKIIASNPQLRKLAAKPAPKKPTSKPKKPAAKTSTARGAALHPDDMPCCPYEALAVSLRLAGKPVGADDVLALYHATTGSSGAATSILTALAGAQRFGLAGAYPTFRWAEVPRDGTVAGVTIAAGPHAVTLEGGGAWTWGEWRPVSRDLAVEEAWEVSWH